MKTEQSPKPSSDPRYKGGWFDPSKTRAPIEPKRHAGLTGDTEANSGGMRENQERDK